ncbi:unnamed protein product, partial [Mesorhabditis spiculigera]
MAEQQEKQDQGVAAVWKARKERRHEDKSRIARLELKLQESEWKRETQRREIARLKEIIKECGACNEKHREIKEASRAEVKEQKVRVKGGKVDKKARHERRKVKKIAKLLDKFTL